MGRRSVLLFYTCYRLFQAFGSVVSVSGAVDLFGRSAIFAVTRNQALVFALNDVCDSNDFCQTDSSFISYITHFFFFGTIQLLRSVGLHAHTYIKSIFRTLKHLNNGIMWTLFLWQCKCCCLLLAPRLFFLLLFYFFVIGCRWFVFTVCTVLFMLWLQELLFQIIFPS